MSGVRRTVLVGLPVLGLACLGAVWALGRHDTVFSERGLLEADAKDLKQTIVSPHLEAPLSDDDNVMWCGTFQLAWNDEGWIFVACVASGASSASAEWVRNESSAITYAHSPAAVSFDRYIYPSLFAPVPKCAAGPHGPRV